MAPLIFLLATFGILYALNRYIFDRRLDLSVMGRFAMAVMLIVTAISHFTSTDVMVEMMPDFIPAKREAVYLTGVIEILFVIGLLWERMSKITSVLLVFFFLAVLPANVIGSVKKVQLGGMEYGMWYLLFRVPLQVFLMWWAWYFGLKVAEPRR